MKTSQRIRIILFALVYGVNLLLVLILWLCGISGDILLGIFAIIFYRLSLWLSPFMVTAICWLPLKPRMPVRKKLIFNFVHLLFCGILFLTCYLLFGNWY
ncbi:MAG: hypothetical protein J6B80_08155 [Clostridia bacterium]|nr:hypothetical protein [Clostridia bacterium]